ncbi:MAG: GAF domain-containing protein [Planctomycetota bacterium]
MDTHAARFDPPTLLMPGAAAERGTKANAAAPPVFASPPAADTASRLLHHQRMAAVLRGAVEGFDLTGAELCLLDDTTAELRVAVDFGDGPAAAPRPLESAEADLAAMAGGAVVLEDEGMVAEWGTPRRCRAAVCVPVASDATIHGTLWLYSAGPRAFSDGHVQLIEIVAGRLAVEIERRALLDAADAAVGRGVDAAPRNPTSARPAEATPAASVPAAAPAAVDELEVAGHVIEGNPDAFYGRYRLADGRLLVLAGAPIDAPAITGADAANAARVARYTARSLAESAYDAGELLTRVSRRVWRSTVGGEGVSLAALLIDPEECTGTVALAGSAAVLSVRASGVRKRLTDAPPLGWDDAELYQSTPLELSPRERLILAAADPRHANAEAIDRLAAGFRGLSAESHRAMPAERAVAILAEQRNPPQAMAAIRWR